MVDRSILDAQPFLQTNVMGTCSLLEIARQRGCVFLHVSTDEVYGSTPEGAFHEASRCYRTALMRQARPHQICWSGPMWKPTILRRWLQGVQIITGRISSPRSSSRLLFLNAINRKPVPVYGDGMNVRDWIYVTDHCKAVDEVFHKGTTGEIYNIGSRNERRTLKLWSWYWGKSLKNSALLKASWTNLITFVDDRKGHEPAIRDRSCKDRAQNRVETWDGFRGRDHQNDWMVYVQRTVVAENIVRRLYGILSYPVRRKAKGLKIALTGSDGMLGSDISSVFSNVELTAFTLKDFDITDLDASVAAIRKIRPDYLIPRCGIHKRRWKRTGPWPCISC